MESEELDLHLSELSLHSTASSKDDEIDKVKKLCHELTNKHNQLEETTAAAIAFLQKLCEDLQIKHEEKEARVRHEQNQHKELLVKVHDQSVIHISCRNEFDTCRRHHEEQFKLREAQKDEHIATLNKQLEELETSNQQHIATTDAADEDITKLRNELLMATQQQEENISIKQGEMINLQMQNDTLKRTIDDQEAIICEQKQQVAVLEDQMKELRVNHHTHTAQISEYQAKEVEHKDLQNRYQVLETGLNELKEKYQYQMDEYDVQVQRAELQELLSAHEELLAAHQALKNRYQAQGAEHETLKNRLNN